MTADDFDPRRTAVLDTLATVPPNPAPARVSFLFQSPERSRLRYHADSEAFLVIADAWHPGWKAILDPDTEAIPLPIMPTDLFLRGLAVPPGDHEILLVFDPASFRLGGIISALSLFGLALLWALPDPKRRQLSSRFPEHLDAATKTD